jgi:hypothetical protein
VAAHGTGFRPNDQVSLYVFSVGKFLGNINTSGIVICGLNDNSYRDIIEEISHHKNIKIYTTLLNGQLTSKKIITNVTSASDQIDKINAALPMVRDLESSDQEMDELAAKATKTFDDLMDLGFNVDSRFAAEIFGVAGTMLGHALTAKTAKLNKKLKMVDLQMKKLKLDQDQRRNAPEAAMETAHGQVLSRNDLLERLIASGAQNNNKA